MANELLEQERVRPWVRHVSNGHPVARRKAVTAMSGAVSSATGHAYGLARVASHGGLSRATVYRHRAAPDPAAPAGPTRGAE